jgi:hypothetical protein
VTPDQAGAASRKAVARLGTAYLECPRTLRRARELGLTGWAAYVAGRGGALGDVRPDTVASALGLIAPEAVRSGWSGARSVLPPSEVAAQMLAECCRWGAEKLEDAPRIVRLIGLLETVVVAADGTGLPLFAAWRGMPLPGGRVSFVPEPPPPPRAPVVPVPAHASEVASLAAPFLAPPLRSAAALADDPSSAPVADEEDAAEPKLPTGAAAPFSATTGYWSGGPPAASHKAAAHLLGPTPATSGPLDGPGAQAAVALHVLAEHRAAALLIAIRAAGLSPLQALIAGPEGEAAAVAFGWKPPYPAPGPLLRRRAWADALTDHLCGQVFAPLSEKERFEFVELLDLALAHADLKDR